MTRSIGEHAAVAAAPRRVGLIGHLCAGNLGDEMMMRGLLRALEPFAVQPVVLRSRPNDWCDPRHLPGVDFAPRFGRARLQLLRSPLLLSGGTHFHEADAGVSRTRNLVAMALLAVQLLANRVAGGGYHLVAIGLGPLRSKALTMLVRVVLRGARTVTVRDEASRAIAESLSDCAVSITEDLALVCTELATRRNGPRGAGGVLVIPVPDPDLSDATLPSAEQVRAMASAGDRLSVMTMNGNERNRSAVASLSAAAGVIDRSPAAGTDALAVALEEIGDHDIVVSARFHGVLAAWALGRRVLAWPYHPKVTELAYELELPLWDEKGSLAAIGHLAGTGIQRRDSSAAGTYDLNSQIRDALS